MSLSTLSSSKLDIDKQFSNTDNLDKMINQITLRSVIKTPNFTDHATI